MSDEGGWIHCGRCGNLFRGRVGEACPACGGHPVIEEKELAFIRASDRAAEASPAPVPHDGGRHRSSKRRKPRGGLMAFVIGWMVFLGLLAGLGFLLRGDGRDGDEGPGMSESVEKAHLMSEAYQACTTRVGEFLGDTTPEGRARLVHDRAETLRKMIRLGGTVLLAGDDETWEWEDFSTLEIEGRTACEGVVRLDGGRRAEFVFFEDEEGEWGIDWPNLVRYSDHPWSLFLSGDTPAEGEFRLLARRRAGASGQMGDVSSLVFFAPDRWDPQKLGRRSPEVEIDPASAMARQLEDAFADREAGRGAFGSELQEEDPHAMIRVRVRLRRIDPDPEDEDGEARFEVEELLGCHWLSVDPGEDADE